MITLFKSVPVYIKIYTDKIEITNLISGVSVSRSAIEKFSNERLVVANFQNAEMLVRSVLKELLQIKSFLQPSLRMLIHQLEKLEGGLSQVEIRALRDIGEIAGGRYVKVIEQSRPLNPQQALLELTNKA